MTGDVSPVAMFSVFDLSLNSKTDCGEDFVALNDNFVFQTEVLGSCQNNCAL